MDCFECHGEGGYSYPVDIDRRDGSLIEHTVQCEACDGHGWFDAYFGLIELEDLEDFIGDEKWLNEIESMVPWTATPPHG